MSNPKIITIDGPSGSGKGTISKILAQKLNWNLLDSGAIYRVLALAAINAGISPNEILKLQQLAKQLQIEFLNQAERIILNGQDVADAIRSEACGIMASQLAAIPELRAELLALQTAHAQPPGLVADGRDMGTVVFPEAKYKFFLTASTKARAQRRLLQLQAHGINASLHNVLQDLMARDARDETRVAAPLKPAIDAIIIDTTKLSVADVLLKILAHIK